MTAPYDYEGLWTKARLFINRSCDASARDQFDQAALWASFSLELLGKAALCQVSPLLIADPIDDGKSLLIAAGVSSDFAGFKSIPAKAVFSRCARAFRPFNSSEALLIAGNRNDDLHSAAVPFAAIPPVAWWPRYWGQAVLLVNAQDKTLDQFVGPERVTQIETYLAKNKENVRLRVELLLARAAQRLQLVATGALSARVEAELAAASGRSWYLDYSVPQECPACHNEGKLYGDYIEQSEIEYDHDNAIAWDVMQVAADVFACPTCGLTLDGQEFIIEAQLPANFEAIKEVEPEWDDYGND